MKKLLIHIHGGESFDTYDEYLTYLSSKELDPTVTKDIRWRQQYQEFLGDDWQVFLPQMPSPQNSKYHEWKIWFDKYIPFLQDGAVLVGHSLGANFLAKYLTENTVPFKISQLHLVAGCYGWHGGFKLGDALSNIEPQCDNVFIYHSQDDEVVRYSSAEKYKKALPKADLVTFTDRGHFLQPEFPELVKNILKTTN